MTAPTDIPDEFPPVGEVLDVVPGALLRRPAATARVRSLLATLPPGLADQIERAAAECVATAPEGEVLYAACWCDDDDHTFADYVQWRQTRDRACRDRDESAHPAHLIRRITVTEAVA